jgi:hypothetical protein
MARTRKTVDENTFDVILFDSGAAVGRFLDVGTVALLVDDAPTWWPEEKQKKAMD